MMVKRRLRVLLAAFLVVMFPAAGYAFYEFSGPGGAAIVANVPYAPTVTANNRGGTITLGGTPQTLMAANPHRISCALQPQTGDVWINTLGSPAGAAQPAWFVPAPSVWTCPPGFRGAISIFGATTGSTFAAEEDTIP